MFENIKSSTQDAHSILERLLIKRLKEIRNTVDYVEILNVFYRFCASMEWQIQEGVDPQVIPDLYERQKLHKLKHDIHGLGQPCAEKPEILFKLESMSQALGVLYVLEGSTMGGKIIASMIAQQHPHLKSYCSYFNPYGDNAPVMWQKFKENVIGSQHLIDESLMIAGALQAFETLYMMFNEPKRT